MGKTAQNSLRTRGRRQEMTSGIMETSIYVQVVVTFPHKNAKLAHTHAHDVVKSKGQCLCV